MMKKFWLVGLLAACTFSVTAVAADYQEIGPAWVFQSDLSFEDAKDNLVFAIEGRGLVISYISHASDMLNRTAEAVGVTEPVYGDAEIILFCKSDLSHHMVASNPHNIVLCPYSISVYTLPGEEEAAYLSIPAPYKGDPTIKPITELLIEIIEETIEF